MKTKQMVLTALFMGIVFVMGLWPQLGFIQLGPLVQVTIIHIPVIIGGIFLGSKSGLLIGLAFGFGSFMNSMSSGVLFAPVFANPLVSIVPRMIFGYSVHYIYSLFKKVIRKNTLLTYGLTAALATIFHSLMVVPLMFIFGMNNANISSFINGQFGGSILTFVVGIFIGNSLMEVVASTVIAPLILQALDKIE